MKYKGYELLKAIEDGKIKEGSRFKVYRTYNAIAVLEDRTLHFEDGNKRILTTNDLLIYTFELIENKIDIDSIEEDMKILEGIIKGDEDCINAIYSQMKVKNDNDEDIQYYKKEIQSIKNIVDNYLKEKARADKLEKEYSIMLSQLDEREINYKRALKENEKIRNGRNRLFEYSTAQQTTPEMLNKILREDYIPKSKIKDKIEELKNNLYTIEHYETVGAIHVLQDLLEGRK